jgi:aminoacyl-tRNA hydrolase
MIELTAFLGNPGGEYARNRHNAGRLLAARLPFFSALNWRAKFKGRYASLGRVHFLMPETYMNLSGDSVYAAAAFLKITPDRVLVVHDELELPLGTAAVKFAGGLGGHNGLRSMKANFGTAGFWRLRIGIGRPDHNDISRWVLSDFTPLEEPVLEPVLDACAAALVTALRDGPESLLPEWNKKKISPAGESSRQSPAKHKELTMEDPSGAFKALYDVIARLRGPGGCPWDREQTPATLRGDLIEETYEVLEAIDEKESAHVREELGDLFLLVTMLSYMHEQEGLFSVSDVLTGVSEKLVRRHPHVFGDVKVRDSAEVLDNWARIKVEQEGRKPKDSAMDEVSRALPPLDRAWKLQKKAAKLGFDWPAVEGVIGKIREELGEVGEALAAADSGESPAKAAEALEGELGDLLFSVVNLCRFLKAEPSVCLNKTNVKFVNRFKHVEKRMRESGQAMDRENLPLMDRYWEEAKEG